MSEGIREEPKWPTRFVPNDPNFLPSSYDPTIAGWEQSWEPCHCGCGRFMSTYTPLPALADPPPRSG